MSVNQELKKLSTTSSIIVKRNETRCAIVLLTLHIQINTVQVSTFLKNLSKKIIRCLISKTRLQKYICGSHKSRKYDLLSIREGNKRIYFLRISSVFTLECYESILRMECGMLSCFQTSLFPSNTLCISLNNL